MKMRTVIDLSHPVVDGMPVFPGDPLVSVSRHHEYQNGYLVNRIMMGTHAGTHIDAPVHNIRGAATVDEIPIAQFIGKAFVADMVQTAACADISGFHLARYTGKVSGISAVIIKSGWGSHYGKDDFFTSFPGLDESAVDWFCANGIRLVGLETPSVHPVRHREIHEHLLSRGIVVVESLAHVDRISHDYVTFYAVPLNLAGLDGSPVRAFAVEE
jgi:kynurenine formamidase